MLSVREAFRLLELKPGASPEEVRRAYVRLLKVHRPESDPDQFMRLREAYELARTAARDDDDETGEHERQPEQDPALPNRIEAEPEPETGATPNETAIDGVPPAQADDARFVAHRELEEGPDIQGFIDRGEVAQGAAMLTAWLERHPDWLPPPVATMGLLLACFESGQSHAACALQRPFAAAMTAFGCETSFSGDVAVMWGVIRELCATAPALDRTWQRAIAKAANTGDLRQADADIKALFKTSPAAALRGEKALKRSAPMLHATYKDVVVDGWDEATQDPDYVDPRNPAWFGSKKRMSRVSSALGIVLGLVIAGVKYDVFSSKADAEAGVAATPAKVATTSKPVSPDDDLAKRAADAVVRRRRHFREAIAAARQLETDAVTVCGAPVLADAALRTITVLKKDQCPLSVTMDDLRAAPPRGRCPDLVRKIFDAIDPYCQPAFTDGAAP